MTTGLTLIAFGVVLLFSPIIDMLRKYGRLGDDIFARWLFETSLQDVFRIQVAVSLGLAAIRFGIFEIVRPK